MTTRNGFADNTRHGQSSEASTSQGLAVATLRRTAADAEGASPRAAASTTGSRRPAVEESGLSASGRPRARSARTPAAHRFARPPARRPSPAAARLAVDVAEPARAASRPGRLLQEKV